MFNFIKIEKLFFLSFLLFTLSFSMDENKSPREAIKPPPGCLRQNSDELTRMLVELANSQGNVGLAKELEDIKYQLVKMQENKPKD